MDFLLVDIFILIVVNSILLFLYALSNPVAHIIISMRNEINNGYFSTLT